MKSKLKYWICVCDTCELYDSIYIKVNETIYRRSWKTYEWELVWKLVLLAELKENKIPFEWVPIIGVI